MKTTYIENWQIPSRSYSTLLLNLDEIILKGGNQKQFINRLMNHVHTVVKLFHKNFSYEITNDDRRLVLSTETNTPFSKDLLIALSKIPGLHSIFLAQKLPLDLNTVIPAIKQEELLDSVQTFKVETKRSNKHFPLRSFEISREIGHQVLEEFPRIKVDVHHPEVIINLRILSRGIYLSICTLRGVGGLPAGSNGHAITLLSGGFDSPVASYLMSKRGLAQDFVFFWSYPFVGEEICDKIITLVKQLSPYQLKTRLHIVPFGEIQKYIASNCNPTSRTLLFRRFMVEGANLLAQKISAQVLITGDALGQVASQTIGNISIIDQCSPLPIFRPLIGYNKLEIIELASKIGTYPISIRPQDDACSLLADKNPATKVSKKYWDHFKKVTNDQITPLLEKAITNVQILEFMPNGEQVFS